MYAQNEFPKECSAITFALHQRLTSVDFEGNIVYLFSDGWGGQKEQCCILILKQQHNEDLGYTKFGILIILLPIKQTVQKHIALVTGDFP